VTHELQSHILQALRENQIEIPFPQQQVYLRGVAAEPRPGLDQDQRSTGTEANPSSAA
jgi:small-conductance mechanosensitive channel